MRRADIVSLQEKQKIEERLNMYDDLMEKDPKMRKLRAESEAKGRAEELRMTIITLVKGRFPSLVELVEQKVQHITAVDELRNLFEQLIAAPDETVARSLLTLPAA